MYAILLTSLINGCNQSEHFETLECGEHYKLVYNNERVVSLTTEEGKRLDKHEIEELNKDIMKFYDGDMKSFIEYIKDSCHNKQNKSIN